MWQGKRHVLSATCASTPAHQHHKGAAQLFPCLGSLALTRAKQQRHASLLSLQLQGKHVRQRPAGIPDSEPTQQMRAQIRWRCTWRQRCGGHGYCAWR